MRLSDIATSLPTGPFSQLPVRLEQRPARITGVAGALFTALCATLLIVPIGLVAATAADQSATMAIIAGKPFVAVQLGMAMLAAALLLAFAMRRVANRVGRDRTVVIETGRVSVFDRSLFGVSIWTEPLANYRGVAPNIRASLSGSRHELVLKHANKKRDVLIEMGSAIPDGRLQETASLLGVAAVAARGA